jgi:hypothetical protein
LRNKKKDQIPTARNNVVKLEAVLLSQKYELKRKTRGTKGKNKKLLHTIDREVEAKHDSENRPPKKRCTERRKQRKIERRR